MNAAGPQMSHAGFPSLDAPSTCAVWSRQESACGCAGIYSAPAALPLYAEAFEAAGALHRLEAFASQHGPDFYRLPRNTATVTLRSPPHTFPPTLCPLGSAHSAGGTGLLRRGGTRWTGCHNNWLINGRSLIARHKRNH